MSHINQDPEMQKYFSSLPPLVKESIEQSGVKFHSLGQLKSFVNISPGECA